MAKKSNVSINRFSVIEKIIKSVDFKTKEEVVKVAEKMKDIALKNKEYSEEVKNAFVEAYEELNSPELTYDNLLEIKQFIDEE